MNGEHCTHVPWELMSLEMETEKGMTGGGQDYISRLPDGCLASIFNCLDSGDRKNASLVSKRMLKAEGQSRRRLTLHAARPDLLPSLLSRFDAAAKLVIRCHRRSVIDVDDMLILIGKLCGDRIKELVLIGVDVTCVGIESVAWKCKKLERLTLCGSRTNIGDEEISCIAAQCVGLKKVCIKGCPVTNQGIKAFAFGCPKLVEIKVDKCMGVTSEVVDWLGAIRKSVAVNLDVGEIEDGGLEFDSESDGDGDGGGGGDGGGDDGGGSGLQENGVDIPPNLASRQVFRSRFGVFEGRGLARGGFRNFG
ncbi:hypothetical protein RHSIM_Rhsim04G0213200 [Rhododendron simsii]|uniref:F-box domain-containing protein n=1 Tax=Rhododendron simsii TaxID=118357 RepID=A0A834H267_RHOSS|nr:hypothetical protein RHSIM_Rhsim04G0213200 [Rhododendron simsii]